jgi:hypothetical protein
MSNAPRLKHSPLSRMAESASVANLKYVSPTRESAGIRWAHCRQRSRMQKHPRFSHPWPMKKLGSDASPKTRSDPAHGARGHRRGRSRRNTADGRSALMESRIIRQFWRLFRDLPVEIRQVRTTSTRLVGLGHRGGSRAIQPSGRPKVGARFRTYRSRMINCGAWSARKRCRKCLYASFSRRSAASAVNRRKSCHRSGSGVT